MIASGKKTIEVRKTRPKLDVPFKVYIYCTRGKLALLRDDRDTKEKYKFDYWDFAAFHQSNGMKVLGGKVVGEYVCNDIDKIVHAGTTNQNIDLCFCENGWNYTPLIAEFYRKSCLTYAELKKYSRGGDIYGWHISNLKIYDKPKELSEFYHYCGDNPECKNCSYLYVESNEDIGTYEQCCSNNEGCKPLTHPPQSWCYVEEV